LFARPQTKKPSTRGSSASVPSGQPICEVHNPELELFFSLFLTGNLVNYYMLMASGHQKIISGKGNNHDGD
jgi:hypothetical protein